MKMLSCFRKRIKYKIFLNRIGIYKKEKKKLLSLHKLGGVSAILSKLYCAHLALSSQNNIVSVFKDHDT